MKRIVGRSRAICSAAIAFFALYAAPAPAAGPVPLPVPAALAASPDVSDRSARVNTAGTEANGITRRLPGVLHLKGGRSAVWDNSLLARPLVLAHEATTAPKVDFSTRPGEALAGQSRPSFVQQGFTLKVLDRRVQISRVAVTRQRLEIVFTARF